MKKIDDEIILKKSISEIEFELNKFDPQACIQNLPMAVTQIFMLLMIYQTIALHY